MSKWAIVRMKIMIVMRSRMSSSLMLMFKVSIIKSRLIQFSLKTIFVFSKSESNLTPTKGKLEGKS